MQQSEIVIHDNRVYHLGLAKGELATNIFLVGDPARCYKVAAFFDNIDYEIKNREYVTLTGSYQGLPVSVIGTGIGTDNMEIALLEIYTLFEFDFHTKLKSVDRPNVNLIRIGTSGGVQQDLPAGTMAIANYALGMDSTGLYYDHPAGDDNIEKIEIRANQLLMEATPPDGRFKGKIITYASKASTKVTEALIQQAEKTDTSYACGITASSPGFYGPSARYIDGLKNSIPKVKQVLAQLDIEGKKVINMEMESSLLFHICAPLSYQAGTICPIISNPYASDNLIDYDIVIEKAIKIAMSAMVNLCSGSQ